MKKVKNHLKPHLQAKKLIFNIKALLELPGPFLFSQKVDVAIYITDQGFSILEANRKPDERWR